MKKRILIVEDDLLIAESMRDAIYECGYDVANIVTNGLDAINEVVEDCPDLVLMDIRIQGTMDGIETAKEIYSKFEIPIVYLTANADSDTLNRAKHSIFYGYLVKPISEVNLNATLQLAFHKYEADKLLKASQESFHNIVEKNATGIIITDTDGVVQYINPAVEQIFNGKTKSIIGKQFSSIISTGITDIDITRKDGEIGIAEMYTTESEWEGKFAQLTMINDVTERRNKERELIHLSVTDHLTNLLNRRGMIKKIEDEKRRSDRAVNPFTLILCDIDKFKTINDTYGHIMGDIVLKGISKILLRSIRKIDSAARWGGDEFLLLLPETDQKGGLIVAEKIKNMLDNTSILVVNNEKIPVTLTFGVGTLNKNSNINESISKIDNALYQGKTNGRNCTVTINDLSK